MGRESDAPRVERLKYAGSGFAFADVPAKCRPADVPGSAGILVAGLDIFHLLVLTDETSRVEGSVMTALAGASAIGSPPIINHGTEEQKQKWLPGLFDFETSFAWVSRSLVVGLTWRIPKPRRRRLPTESPTSRTDIKSGLRAHCGQLV